MLNDNIETKSMLPVGTLLQGGKYRIERYLSSGGFGNTYVATNTEFDEQVALKEFFMRGISEREGDSVSVSVSNKTNVEQFSSQKDKFRKEARRLRKLRNDHIVAVHDLFEENGTAYYEMDLVDGESLAERMKRTGQPLTESEVRDILPQVLDALGVVHAQGLYHLDLKPANIMMDKTGHALLIDFGASKQMNNAGGLGVTTSSVLALTPGYAPLEQMEQNLRLCGPWTDIYALGATLYKLLTNYSIPSPTELLYGTQLTFSPTVSQQMQELINWMMKPIYGQRPQSAAEVRSFLSGDKNNDESTIIVEPNNHPAEETIIVEPDNHPAEETIIVGQIVNQTEREKPIDLPNDKIVTVGNVSFKMIRVEGGTFMMGSTSEDSDADKDEKPAHQVSLSTFYIGETEVTQELWEAVMDSNPSRYIGPQRPVERVSWEDCQDFIHKLYSLTGIKFRLPTEAEWEYAARGGQASCGYKFAGSNVAKDVAHYNNGWFSIQTTINVATKQPNELGLYDMSGNVWEWCQDWYGPYSPSSQTSPTGSSSGSNRVLRGGSWGYNASYCRVSERGNYAPANRDNDLGLRLAL